MTMINYIVAYHMNKNNMPCIYRIHTVDEEIKRKLSDISSRISFDNNKDYERLMHYCRSICPKSMYSTEAKEHFGLGLPYYTHVSAPLRRYVDNAMKLYVLDPFYFHHTSDKEAYIIIDKLKEICKHVNEKNIIVNSFYQKETPKILTKK